MAGEGSRRLEWTVGDLFPGHGRAVDITWITATLGVGAAPASGRLRGLRRGGVTAILDLRVAGERRHDPRWEETIRRLGLRLRLVAVPDRRAPTPGQFAEACAWIVEELAGDGRVLVCCRAGIGRSATVATAVLVRLGYSLPAAFQLVGGRRPVANPTEEQLGALRLYAARAVVGDEGIMNDRSDRSVDGEVR